MADILVFSPHPDDAELGMGGTIARLCAEGRSAVIVDLTSGEPTPHGSPEIRARETAEANAALGNPVRENLGLPNRWLEVTLENRRLLAAVIRRHRPELLFIPYPLDAHPDHLAVHDLALRARFDAKLTGTDIPGAPWYPRRIVHYYCTHLRLVIQPTFLLDITAFAQAKRAAMDAYRSQFHTGRPKPGEVPEMVMTACAYFGSRVGVAYAEPFHTDEPVALSRLDALI